MSSEELQAIELLGRVRYGRLATSMRALPFLSVARHVVIDGRVVLRMHSGFGYHNACDGTVVAYGADNFDAAGAGATVRGATVRETTAICGPYSSPAPPRSCTRHPASASSSVTVPPG